MKKQIIDKMSTLLTAAFGLVAALAWNDAIKAIFKEVFGTPDKVSAMVSYAILVTIIGVIVTIWIAKVADKEEKKR